MKNQLLLFLCFIAYVCHAQVKVYDYPEGKEGLTPMHDFAVSSLGQEIKTYQCEVNPHKKVQKASWCQFEALGDARIRVTKCGEKIQTAIVRPQSKGIKHTQVNDSTIEFTVPAVKDNRGYSLEVDINGDREHCLHIFVDGPEKEVYEAPDPDSKVDINWKTLNNHDVFVQNPRLIYFGPGIHKPHDLPSAEIKIPSGATVYIAPGAVVRARLIVDRAENVRIIGRGVLLNPLRGVEITYSKNVEIDGLTVINPQHYTVFGGQSENITIHNVRSFSRHPWSDGFDLMCCKNVTIEDVFLRNNDDAFAIYNHRWWYWGGTDNYHIRRATIFNDLAHPFNFGSHGDDRSDTGELLHNVWIEDCDILSADCDGIFAVRCGDKNMVEDIHFENIRIEDVVRAALFNIQVNFSEKYNRAPGNYIRDIWFKDIYFNGDVSCLSPDVIKSYDSAHTVSDLHFDNIRVNGKKMEIGSFLHPGLLHSQNSIERMQRLYAEQDSVAMGSYQKLVNDAKARTDYKMRGPYGIIARDGQYGKTKGPCENDFLAAYYNALIYTTTRNAAHAEKAMEIIRAYSNILTRIDGHDAPLCAALQGFILINACELLRYGYNGWKKSDTKKTEQMFRTAFLPVLDEFDRQSPYANGNWGAAVCKMRLAIGVYCNDEQQYQRGISYFYEGNDDGALKHYIAESGQCQESGRDQAHVMLGLGQLAEICEMAWSQGEDLYGALDNRLLKGYEYSSKANLGYSVPFTTWTDLTGKYCNWTVLSEGALGQWRSVFEIAYNHYVGRKHLEMPYTSQVLGHFVRPEGAGFTCDNPGFGTFLFYQKTEVDSTTVLPTMKSYSLNEKRDYSPTEEPIIRLKDAAQLTLVRTVDCWPEYWDLTPVRTSGDIYEYEPLGAKSRNGYTFGNEKARTTFLVVK